MSELVLAITHIGDKERARKTARRMIQSHLAASVQFFAIEKMFRRRGQWIEEQVWRLTLVTTRERYPALEAALRARHQGEGEPHIVAVPCVEALPLFADWVGSRVLESENTPGVRPQQAVNYRTDELPGYHSDGD